MNGATIGVVGVWDVDCMRMIRAVCSKKRGRFKYVNMWIELSVAWFATFNAASVLAFNVVLFCIFIFWSSFSLSNHTLHARTGTKETDAHVMNEKKEEEEEEPKERKKKKTIKNGVKTWTTGIFVSFAFDLFW